MTDKYKDLRDALAAGPTPGPWEWITEVCERGPVGKGRTIRVSLSAPRNGHAHARTAVLAPNWSTSEGDVWQAWISCNEANAAYIAAAHPEAIRALLAERDALREALRPLAGIDLTEPTPIDFAWFVLRARAALAQEQS